MSGAPRPVPGRRRRDDRGAGAVDLAVMGACFFVPVVLLLVFAGRMNAGHAAVESAARHAARTISIARSPEAALARAEDDARTTVREGSPMCLTMDFDPDPGTERVSATAVEVLDTHREGVAR